MIQRQIDVKVASTDFLLYQKTRFCQRVQVARGRHPRNLQITLQKLDLGIRVAEQVIDQVLAVKLVLFANAVFVVHQRGLDGLHRPQSSTSGDLHRFQHVKHPVFPNVVHPNALQQVVISALVAHNVLTQVQHGNVKQALFHQKKHIHNAARAAIAVIKRVNRLKLVMNQRHLDQWVCIKQPCIIDEPLQIGHQRNDLSRILRRRVNGSACAVFQRCTRQLSKACVIALQLALNLNNVV